MTAVRVRVAMVGLGLGLGLGKPAAAQPAPAEPLDIEVPTLVLAADDQDGRAVDTELDLTHIVESAAKAVTTVQEAPAIVTIATESEIADRQFSNLEQLIDTVPGWLRFGAYHSQFPIPLVRGQLQAMQLLHDGVTLFDPYTNVGTVSRVQPMETLKRVELITGPGGVLWGSSSLLGIINLITKDAADVDGVEVGGRFGFGQGDRAATRAYVLAGLPELGGRADLLVHASFESYLGPGFEMPSHLVSAPLPQPNAPSLYGPLERALPSRSFIFNLFGKLSVGRLELRVQAPFVERHLPLGFPGYVTRPSAPDNQVNFFERYLVAEYRRRSRRGRASVAARAYVTQFVRDFAQLAVLRPVPILLDGGLSFRTDATTYRVGSAVDGSLELGAVRLLYGAEALRDWLPDRTARSRQGAGSETEFLGPDDLGRLPLPCPRDVDDAGQLFYLEGCPLTFTFAASRTVLGAYGNAQLRLGKRLLLDGGARLQVAPASLGTQPYAATPTFSAAVVYGFIPDWNLKLELAQGFRPPVFNNTNSNGEATQIDGDRDLDLETSTATQVEINARVFKGRRRIRELAFRADYSYTRLDRLIQIVGGRYQNSDARGIHSAELLAKIYITGGHRIELAYTWLKVLAADVGAHRGLPEHWFNLAGVWNLVDGRLTGTANLRVLGAMEDPNRLVEYRGRGYDELGRVIDLETMAESPIVASPHDLVMDRLPPSADLTLGLSFTPTPYLELAATVQNALGSRHYQPDAFFNYEPRLELLPNPYEDLRAYVEATVRY